MNYHVEHHMFPMVPYHALPALHDEIKHDCPTPYPSTWAAYKEIFYALPRQSREPGWWVDRKLPTPKKRRQFRCGTGAGRVTHLTANLRFGAGVIPADPQTLREREPMSWVEVCAADDIEEEDVMRFDHDGQTFAIYRSPDNQFFATDGLCTHEKVHLADGLVMDENHRMPETQRPVQLHDRSGQGRARFAST